MSRWDNVFISRTEWSAKPPKSSDTSFAKGGGVVIHHTAADTREQDHWPGCYARVQAHQRYHQVTKGWRDIAYNFVVCKHGFIFEGRGWTEQNAANRPVNAETLSLAFDVNGVVQVLDPAAIASANLIVEKAVNEHGWANVVRGHDEANGIEYDTTCPSPHIENLIETGVIHTANAASPTPATPTQPAPVGVPSDQEVRLVAITPTVTVRQMQDWARGKNATATFVRLAPVFWEEATRIGLDPAIPYALSLHETGGGRFGGVVTEAMHNWGGLKTPSGGGDYDRNAHAVFPDDRIGVRAVVQHVGCYAGVDLPAEDIVDPRWSLAVLGMAPTLPSDGWKWSSSPQVHGERVAALTREIRGVS